MLAPLASAASTTAPPDCGTTAFSVLTTNPNLALCRIKSEVPILTLKQPPTPDQFAVSCKTEPCRDLIELSIDLDPAECTIPFDDHLLLRSDLIDRATQQCARVGRPLKPKATPLANGTASQSQPSVASSSTTVKNDAAVVATRLVALVAVALAML